MSTQTVFVASDPGQTLQPIPFRSSSDEGTTIGITGGLWSTGASAVGTGELPIASLGIGFSRVHGELNPPPYIIPYAGKLLFSDGGLWVTDGTPLGTYQIVPNLFSGVTDYNFIVVRPPDFTAFKGEVLFVGDGSTGLYVTDGTAGGTHQLVTQSPIPAYSGVTPTDLTVLGNQVLFSGYVAPGTTALWSTDGAANTAPLLDSAGQQVDSPGDLTVFGTKALFSAADGSGGYGLWITDGTAAGTSEIPVSGSQADGTYENGLSPNDFTVVGAKALFTGNDASGQEELWVTDGTAAGTSELAVPGASTSTGIASFFPGGLTAIGTKAIFVGNDANGNAGLWVTDGTTAGTAEIATGLSVSSFDPTSGRVVFTVLGSTSLYVTDGTAAGTGVLAVPGASAAGLDPGFQDSMGGLATFTGFDASGSLGLWSTDGTPAGTREILSGLPRAAVGPLDFATVTSPPLYLTSLQTPGFSGSGTLSLGSSLAITLGTNQAVTVNTAAGSPTLALSNGATASYVPGLSTPTQLAFSYTVAGGQDTSDLSVGALALDGAQIADGTGDTITSTSLTGFSTSNTGLQVSTMPILPIHVLTDAPVFAVPGAGLLTNSTSPLLTGSATPGSTVQVYDNRTLDGTGFANATTGAFAVALATLAPGIQQITAMSMGPGEFSSLPSATVPIFGLPSAVNGVSSVDVASIDVASVLGQGFALQFTGDTEAVQLLDGTLSVGPDTDAAYVARLYQGLFGTVPGSGDLSIWTNYLAAGHSQTDVAAGFLAAPAAAPLAALPDGQFVQQIFAGLLGHAPTADQFGAFTGVLASGASRAAVLAGIADSPEAKSALAPQTARLFVTDTATQGVNDLFRAGLGHDATQAVVQNLGALVQAGLTAVQLAQDIASTPEFLGLHAGESDASYVTDVYSAGLGRAPTGSELSFDVGNLQSGAFDRSTILAAVATSPEGIAHLTQSL